MVVEAENPRQSEQIQAGQIFPSFLRLMRTMKMVTSHHRIFVGGIERRDAVVHKVVVKMSAKRLIL